MLFTILHNEVVLILILQYSVSMQESSCSIYENVKKSCSDTKHILPYYLYKAIKMKNSCNCS